MPHVLVHHKRLLMMMTPTLILILQLLRYTLKIPENKSESYKMYKKCYKLAENIISPIFIKEK